jgi:hypothetical protein
MALVSAPLIRSPRICRKREIRGAFSLGSTQRPIDALNQENRNLLNDNLGEKAVSPRRSYLNPLRCSRLFVAPSRFFIMTHLIAKTFGDVNDFTILNIFDWRKEYGRL